MSIVAPHVRKHLSADTLFRLVHSGFASLPDHRLDDPEISFTDTLMSAFAMFSLKAPSLLAFDKERAEGNLHTIYGIARVPCDPHSGIRGTGTVACLAGSGHGGQYLCRDSWDSGGLG